MAENLGKKFEGLIKEAFEKECYILRLYDTTNGFLNVNNPCDFIAYDNPNMFMLECKSCHGASLPITNIADNQRTSLLKASKYGVVCGYLIWYIDKDRTIFISADDLETYLLETGRKSLEWQEDKYSFDIVGTKKRKFFDYNMKPFLERFKR